jgi:hypothetical protein
LTNLSTTKAKVEREKKEKKNFSPIYTELLFVFFLSQSQRKGPAEDLNWKTIQMSNQQ